MPSTYLDRMLTHAVYFERYKTHEVNQLLKVLDAANVACKAEVAKTDGAATKSRYVEIMKKIGQIRDEAVSKLDGQLSLDLHGLISSEIDFQDKTLKSILGAKLNLTLPAPEKVYTAATFMPFAQSQTFEKMMNDVSSDFYSTWDMSVRAGYLTGDTAQTINRRVLGSVKALQPGTMQKLRNALDSNTRTMLSHFAEQTRNSIYRANEDLFFGYKRLETLDSRTCLVCGALDGKVYKTLDEAPPLPAHNCCRGLYIPLIKGIDNEEGERASVDGPVSAKMSYEDWLKRQSDDVQKDVLGPSRYRLFKNGASLGSFVTDGRTLTLAQWKTVEGNTLPETVIGRFLPAKSISEANEWAMNNLGIKNNSTLELDSLNKVNARLFELKNEYQFNIKSIGDEKAPYASASMSRMNFYTKYANDEELLKSHLDKDIANKFHCDGCNTLKSIIDHEFAHTMTIPDLIPGIENNDFLQEIRRIKTMYTRQLHKGSDILISRYASTNNDEFVAESFAMALNSEKPSPFAKMVLDLIQKKYGRK